MSRLVRAFALLVAFAQGCGCAHPCSKKAWETPLKLRGRPAHVCACSMNADGTANVTPCLDEPIQATSAKTASKCSTACDIRADVSAEECKALNAVEAMILKTYADNVPEFRPAYASCMGIAGYKIQIIKRDEKRDTGCPAGSWKDANRCVIGLTHYETATIDLFDTDWQSNALTHEIGHVLDREYGTEQGGHCAWGQRGIKKAIYDVTGELDLTPEFCEQ